MAEEQVKSLAEQGEGLLKQILPSLNLTSAASTTPEKDEGAAEKEVVADDEKKIVLIKDVRAWKASLPASQGPQQVKDLTEFEDFEAKL